MGKTLRTGCKLCRREGVSLCGREKCAVKRRPYPPGVHGPLTKRGGPRLSGYGKQLREKQKAKRLYNLMERQFRRYFEMARGKRGNTATFLVQILERRLDNVVYRLGFAKTRRQARQMVSHGFFTVNGTPVNIPSHLVRVGDDIRIKETKINTELVKGLAERLTHAEPARWLHLDVSSSFGKVVALPEGEDLETVFDPTMIVELYSR
jgi:small subunit ribosomal protein S4